MSAGVETRLQVFDMGDHVVTTIHRVDATGEESAEILSMTGKLKLSLVEDTPKAKGHETIFNWRR